MRKIYLLLFSIGILFTNAQNSPASLQWTVAQNGYGQTNNVFVKSKIDASGNVFSLFYSDYDMLVVKYNSATQIVNRYRYNNYYNSYDFPRDFEIDNSGNVYVTGDSYTGLYPSSFAKFDAVGNQLFETQFIVDYNPVVINSIATDNNGGLVFTGKSGDSLVVGKINQAGAIQWVTRANYNGNYIGEGLKVRIDGFNSIYVCGKIQNGNGDKDAVAIKINANGTQTWARTIAGTAGSDDAAIDLGFDNSSNLIVYANVADVSSTNYSGCLTKYNASGGQLWQKKIQNAGQETCEGVKLIVDNIGNSYFGMRVSEAGGQGYSKLYKYNLSGTLSYEIVLDEPTQNNTYLTDMYKDLNNNVYASGKFENTEVAFYSKVNSFGSNVFFNSCNYCGSTGFGVKVGIVAEENGFFNLLSDGIYARTYNARFNSAGIFQFDNFSADESNPNDFACNVIANGNEGAYSLGFKGNQVTNGDAVVTKFDGQGNILWQNILDNNNQMDLPSVMAKDANYNLYVALTSGGNGEIHKIDSSGVPVWNYSSPRFYQRVVVGSDEKVYLAGDNMYSSANFNIAKLNSDGTLNYENTLTPSIDTILYTYDLKVDNNENMVVCGSRVVNPSGPIIDFFGLLEKYSSTGTLLWSVELPLTPPAVPISIQPAATPAFKRVLIDASDNVYLLGAGMIANDFAYTLLNKYDPAGNLIWTQTFDGSGITNNFGDVGFDMAFLSDGSLVLYSGINGAIIRRINPADGNVIWMSHVNDVYSYIEEKGINALRIDQFDNIYFTGSAQGFSFSNGVVMLSKMDSSGNIIWQTHRNNPIRNDETAKAIDISDDASKIYVSGNLTGPFGESTDYSVMKFCDIPQPIISVNGSLQNLCAGNTVELTVSGGNNYVWNDNTTNTSLTATSTGNYYCTAYQYDGCNKTSDTVNVQYKTPPVAPQICMVTVDSASTHNIIIWDKTGITDASAFNIYREDVTNSYSYIGTVVYDSLSEFHDYGADPNVTTKRYKISSMDACGQESELSNYHNTLYIVDNGNGQFSWNPLYTIQNNSNPVNNYLLMRDDNNTGNWVQIQSTAGTQNTIVDPLYSNFPNANWRVETAWNISCESTVRLNGNEIETVIVKSKSNIKNNRTIGLNNISNSEFVITPNPAVNNINVKISSFDAQKNAEIIIIDELGRVLIQKEAKQNNDIDVTSLNPGVYFVKLNVNNIITIKKFVKL